MANEIVVPKADLTESDVLAKLNELDDEPEKKIESKSNKEEDELDIPDIKEKEDKPEKKVAKSKEDESEEDETEDDDESWQGQEHPVKRMAWSHLTSPHGCAAGTTLRQISGGGQRTTTARRLTLGWRFHPGRAALPSYRRCRAALPQLRPFRSESDRVPDTPTS